MSIARKIFSTGIILIIVFLATTLILPNFFRDTFFDFYTRKLDAWVNGGGKIEGVQDQVVRNCGMLVMTQAGTFERLQLVTFYRDEFDFRVDVCTKMTVNRIHKQPEFEKPNIVNMICDDTAPFHELFPRLCRKSGLR